MEETASGPRREPASASAALYREHARSYATSRYVYPVLSRRSRGISIGVNLNPDKICNFDCIYCQVDRTVPATVDDVDPARLLTELDRTLELVTSGELFASGDFQATPPALRRLNDIALSGDGEPTTYRRFDELIAQCAELKRRRGLDDVKLVLITNASMFHRPNVQRGLATLDQNQGEIWAKLDAGSDAYYHRVERTSIPFGQVLENITAAARVRPLVIQSLFLRIDGQGPPPAEIEAYCQRLREIVAAGGQIKLVQVYTVARRPAESCVTHLPSGEVDAIADQVARRTGLPVEAYYGPVTD